MADNPRDERLRRLDALVGEWRLDAPAVPLPPELAGEARSAFEWALDGTFLVQRSSVPVPEAPDGLCVVGLDDGDGYTQHYFDSRGIARVYAMTFDDGVWTLLREKPDFTALDFSQRYRGELSSDGKVIEGRWEIAHEPGAWEVDFQLTYRRVERGGRDRAGRA